jgi:site-specific DNA recombinase
MLRNPYYMGIVVWEGRRHVGRHQPLVSQDTFDQVQALLTSARVSGDRPQVHEHYLRGTVVCAECLGRLLYGRHKGRSSHYEYFSCINRAARRRQVKCSTGHYAVDTVEEEVEQLYASLRIRPAVQDQIRREIAHELRDRTTLIEREAERHERMLKRIEAKQEKLVQLYYEDLITEDVFAREQSKLKAERQAANRLRTTAAAQLEDIEAALELALSRADHPDAAYRAGTELERRLMNLAIFTRIEIGPEGDVTETALTPVYTALRAWKPGLGAPGSSHGPHSRSGAVRLSSACVHHHEAAAQRPNSACRVTAFAVDLTALGQVLIK